MMSFLQYGMVCMCAFFKTWRYRSGISYMDFSGPFLDVKPSNMLVNTRGQVKLCDFGVSTQVGLFSSPQFALLSATFTFYFQSTFWIRKSPSCQTNRPLHLLLGWESVTHF